jgi:phosphohistidine phosphatase SixA
MSLFNLSKVSFLLSACCLIVVVASSQLNAQELEQRNSLQGANQNAGKIKQDVIVNKVYLLRHFEKQNADASADAKDPNLTQTGLERAQHLADFLADKNIIAIFSTKYKRTQQSVKPTADKLGLIVNRYDPSKLSSFATQLQAMSMMSRGSILVVGHSNTTPELLQLLGGPEISMTEADYGDLFYLNLTRDQSEASETFQQTTIE